MVVKTNSPSRFVFGVATRPALMNDVNGDAYLIKQWDDHILVALIDGLGHGEEAAKASEAAKEFVSEHFDKDLEQIMRGLHDSLTKTRGAVVGMTRIDLAEKRFAFCGVGNIEAKLIIDPPIQPVSRDGIVGANMIKIKKFEYHYDSLKAIVLHSDGVSSKFDLPKYKNLSTDPQKIAKKILNDCWNGRDDATVIFAEEEPTYN